MPCYCLNCYRETKTKVKMSGPTCKYCITRQAAADAVSALARKKIEDSFEALLEEARKLVKERSKQPESQSDYYESSPWISKTKPEDAKWGL